MRARRGQLVGTGFELLKNLPLAPPCRLSECFEGWSWVSCPVTESARVAVLAALGHVIWNGQV